MIIIAIIIIPQYRVTDSSNIQSRNSVLPLASKHIKELASTLPKLPSARLPLAGNHGIQSYPHAVKTPDGNYTVPLRTADEHGRPLTIHYEKSSPISRITKLPLSVIQGPSSGLYQEGAYWQYTSDPSRVGLYEYWTVPSLSTSGSSVAMYFNPVNFYYPIAAPNYNFFQVDYAYKIPGLVDGWYYTFASLGGTGGDQYNILPMSAVPVIPGDTYIVDAYLVPYPIVPIPVYAIQITHGGQSWLYTQTLGYQPLTGYVYGLSAFQDQYIESSGTITMTPDVNAKPGLVKDVSNLLVTDGTRVTGMIPFDDLNPVPGYTTWDILSPNIINSTAFSDNAASSSWPLSCAPPDSGDWTITTGCTLSSSANAEGNVIVQGNSRLTIPISKSLNINFTQYHLLVKSGSGVLIKSGAKLSGHGDVTITSGSGSSSSCASSNICYVPNIEVIPYMHTVKWTNRDSVGHTVTSGKPSDSSVGTIFDSGLIAAGSTFSYTFQNSGTYNYFCTVHPWMTGQVVVR